MRYLVIHTGGTIGMVKTPSGFAVQPGIVEAEIKRLNREVIPASLLCVEVLSPLIDSALASPADWSRIANTIKANYYEFDGFLVTHGTDTLVFTAAALCFALQGLNKPVILTGSMLPLTVEGNDGTENLVDAISALGKTSAGVWVQFSGNLLSGSRLIKKSSIDFEAFTVSKQSSEPLHTGDSLTLHPYPDAKIPILTLSPGISGEIVNTVLSKVDGVVLRCYGAGTAPYSQSLERAFCSAYEREVPILAVSQCFQGGINLYTYKAGATLRENGILDGRDITAEAALVKLYHALGRGGGFEETRSLLTTPLCGEMS